LKVVADRSFVTEFLARRAFGPEGDQLRGLRDLKSLADRPQLVVDISTVSAFGTQLRAAIDEEIAIEFLHRIAVGPAPPEIVEAAQAKSEVVLEAENYILAKGGAGQSVQAEIAYCAQLIWVSASLDAALLAHPRRRNLIVAVLECLGAQPEQPWTEAEGLNQRGFDLPPALARASQASPQALRLLWFRPESRPGRTMRGGPAEDQAADRRILVLAANPKGTRALDLEEELRAIETQVRMAKHGQLVSVAARTAARPDDLIREVRELQPAILHFSGHGEAGGILLRDDFGGYSMVSGEALKRFLRGRGVGAVVFNSCHSEAQAEMVCGVVEAVVGTTDALDDEAARLFSSTFYRTLCDGHTIGEAARDAADAIAMYQFKACFRLYGDEGFRLFG
jgi:hypothetical protein